MLTVVLAVVVLFGWIANVPVLRSAVPGAVEMKFNTAAALLLAACASLLFNTVNATWARRTGQGLGITVALIGALTLSQYLFNWQLGIDQLLIADHARAYNAIPGRMSPYSTVALIGLGVALLALPWRHGRLLVLIGAIIELCIGALSVLGYAWNATELTTDQWLPPVALNSAIAFVVLGVSVLCAMRTRTSQQGPLTPRGRLERKLLIAFAGALGLLFIGGGITYQLGVKYSISFQWESHTQEVRAQLGRLAAAVAEAEDSARDYQLHDEPDDMQAATAAAASASRGMDSLHTLVRDNPLQLARAATLRIDLQQFIMQLHDAMTGTATTTEALATLGTDGAALRAQMTRMDDEEASLAAMRAEAVARQRGYTLIALVTTLGIATIALSLLFGGIARDLRERERITLALAEAERRAQAATHAKSEFLAAMSHEIRTPMNGVIGMIDVLQQSSLKEAQLEMVELIHESADALLTIIDDILDFSKIEAGRMQLERIPLSLADVIEKSCVLLRRLAERKGVTLAVYVDPDIPSQLIGDPGRLRQVLVNLISNAIKFSSKLRRAGHVCVRAQLQGLTADSAQVLLRVADNGVGMDELTRARLFTPFTQADASTTRRYGGTGLGLSISKHLVDMMQGGLDVDTAADRGAVFSATFTLALAGENRPPKTPLLGLPCLLCGMPGPDRPIDLGGQSLLLTDADLVRYLQAAGAAVATVSDPALIESWTRDQPQGVVLVPLAVDGSINGQLEVICRCAAQVSRLVLLAYGEAHERRINEPDCPGARIVALGANALTRRALHEAVRDGTDAAPAPAHNGASAGLRPLSRAAAIAAQRLILVAEDNEINRKVILHQLTLLGHVADFATTGLEALQRVLSGAHSLLLTDLHMPELDGYSLTAAIRNAEAGTQRHLPIIALTANAVVGEGERCRAAGMDDFLSKPASITQLGAMLERWLPPRPPGQSALHESTPAAQLPATDVIDLRELLDLVGSDTRLLQELLRDFVRTTAQSMAELVAASARQQPAEIAAIAHTLKAPAKTIGAQRLGALSEALETAGRSGDRGTLTQLLPQFIDEIVTVNRHIDALCRDSEASA